MHPATAPLLLLVLLLLVLVLLVVLALLVLLLADPLVDAPLLPALELLDALPTEPPPLLEPLALLLTPLPLPGPALLEPPAPEDDPPVPCSAPHPDTPRIATTEPIANRRLHFM